MTQPSVRSLSMLDAQKFCLEESIDFGSIQESDGTIQMEVSEDILSERRERKKLAKDHKRSNSAKKTWRTKRRSIMRGIKRFHRSTEGKRFHRKLGRLSATRDTRSKNEWLVGVQSLLTHLSIEETYVSSLDEEAELELLHEMIRPVLVGFCDTLVSDLHEGRETDFDSHSEALEIIEDLISGVEDE